MNSHLLSRSLVRPLARALRIGFAAGLVGGCAPPGELAVDVENDADDEGALSISTRYVAIEEALPPAQRHRWHDVRTRLFEQFDEICGDTFCGGDWSNLEPLELTCSASVLRGSVRECAWTFAASEESIDPAGGDIEASIPTFTCRITPKGNAEDLLRALADDPLWAPLPGGGASIYDQLSDCFETPVGATPLGDPSVDGPYVNASDTLEEGEVDAWYTMTSALRAAYEAEAEGEAAEPRPLRFRCSEDENTRAIGSCAWMFAGARHVRNKSGTHRIFAERHVCSFRPQATTAELAAALGPLPTTGAGPLDRPIPGGEATLREILDACL